MAIGLGVVWLWRTRVFEAAVDAAAEGHEVGLRAAYNQFWLVMGGFVAIALLAGGGLAFFDVKKLLIAG